MSWREVVDPSPAELEELGLQLDAEELPKVEKLDGTLLLVMRTPAFHGPKADIPYQTQNVYILLREGSLVLVSRAHHNLLAHLGDEQRQALKQQTPQRMLLTLLRCLPHSYLHPLGRINKAVEALEERLQESLENREVLQLLRYQKSLVYFTTGLRTNAVALERLKRRGFLTLEGEDEDLFDDILTEHEEAIQVCQISSEILSNMMDAFTSIISNNLNVVIKRISSLAVILVIPATVATFYGMNVPLPLHDHPQAFTLLLAASVVGAVLATWFFRRKDWL